MMKYPIYYLIIYKYEDSWTFFLMETRNRYYAS